MKKEYNHVFKRNMDTINSALEHILNDGSLLSKDMVKGYFETIKMALAHCEELALSEECE